MVGLDGGPPSQIKVILAPPSSSWRAWRSHDAADLELDAGEVDPTKVFLGEGKGVGHEPQRDTLEEIIAAIDEQFGTDVDQRDRLEVEKVQMTLNAYELKPCPRVQRQVQARDPRYRG